MAGYTTEGKAVMLGALRTAIDEVSLHTADPGTDGSNEVSGGGYARADGTYITFNAVSGGEFTLADDVDFSGTAGTSATYFGIWQSDTFLGSGAITGDTTFNSEGEFTLQAETSINLNLECS